MWRCAALSVVAAYVRSTPPPVIHRPGPPVGPSRTLGGDVPRLATQPDAIGCRYKRGVPGPITRTGVVFGHAGDGARLAEAARRRGRFQGPRRAALKSGKHGPGSPAKCDL